MSFSINERSYEKAFEDEVVRIFKSMGYDIIDGEKTKDGCGCLILLRQTYFRAACRG